MPLCRYDAAVILGAEFWTDVHPATVLLGGLTALIFVVLIGLILGPAGRPTPPRHRAGGFSRAIADRTDGEGAAQ
jgi:hypothetical protein